MVLLSSLPQQGWSNSRFKRRLPSTSVGRFLCASQPWNAEIVKLEGRKAWLEGRIKTLEAGGTDLTLIVETHALFVESKQATVSIGDDIRAKLRVGTDGL